MKIAIVLYTTDPNFPAVKFLTGSMEAWGWPKPIIIEGNGSFMGLVHKVVSVRNLLPTLMSRGYTHVLYSDCWDVLCVGPFSEVEEKVKKYQARGLVSADAACWEGGGVTWDQFPDSPTRWKYLNSGGWFGELGHMYRNVLKGCDKEQENDQWFFSRQWLSMEGWDQPELDYNCEVFQCLSQVPREVFEVQGDRVLNKETGTRPCLIHGAGGADMSWVPSSVGWRLIDRFNRTGD